MADVRPGDTVPPDRTSTAQVLQDTYPAPCPNGEYLRYTSGQVDPLTTSLSAPAFDARERLVGALTLSGPIGRFDPPSPSVRGLLLAEARDWSTMLGSRAHYAFAPPEDDAARRPPRTRRAASSVPRGPRPSP